MRLFREETGQDLAEYGIALAVIAIGVAAAVLAIQGDITALWESAHEILHQEGGH